MGQDHVTSVKVPPLGEDREYNFRKGNLRIAEKTDHAGTVPLGPALLAEDSSESDGTHRLA